MEKKKPTPAEARKRQVKKLEAQLDKLWSQAVHKRWGEQCAWPGCVKTSYLAAHHFVHRSQGNRARWLISNSVVVCYGHHIGQIHRGGNTEPIREVLINRMGIGSFERMMVECKGVWKPTLEELLTLEKELTNLLKGST